MHCMRKCKAIKLAVCLGSVLNWTLSTCGPHEGILFPDLGIRWRWVVSITLRPLYLQGENPDAKLIGTVYLFIKTWRNAYSPSCKTLWTANGIQLFIDMNRGTSRQTIFTPVFEVIVAGCGFPPLPPPLDVYLISVAQFSGWLCPDFVWSRILCRLAGKLTFVVTRMWNSCESWNTIAFLVLGRLCSAVTVATWSCNALAISVTDYVTSTCLTCRIFLVPCNCE